MLFASIQERLDDAGPSYTAEQIAKGQAPTAGPARTGNDSPRRAVVRVEPPAAQMRAFTPADFLRVGVPANWSQVNAGGGATYTPQGAFFQAQSGQTAFTHGVQFGVTQGTGNLQRDTQALLQGLARGNPNLRSQSRARRDSLGGRSAITATLSNVSDVTGQQEHIAVTTTTLPDGNVLYMIGVAPQSEARTYEQTFRRVRQSVTIAAR